MDFLMFLEAAAGLSKLGIGLGIGLVVIGAGLAIGKIGSGSTQAMARQPEIAGDIRTAMILALAFIEGIAFFGLIASIIALVLG